LFDALLRCHVDTRWSAQLWQARPLREAIPASALPIARDGSQQVAGRVQSSGVNSCLAAGLRNANTNAHARRHSIAQTGSVSDLALGDSRSHPISRSFQTRLHANLVDLGTVTTCHIPCAAQSHMVKSRLFSNRCSTALVSRMNSARRSRRQFNGNTNTEESHGHSRTACRFCTAVESLRIDMRKAAIVIVGCCSRVTREGCQKWKEDRSICSSNTRHWTTVHTAGSGALGGRMHCCHHRVASRR
jgi:hypothetical protein